jgi:HK97 family phage major capsid protein
MEELKKLFEDLKKAVHDFQKANDERFASVEKKGSADPLLVEKVDKANAEITRLQKQIDDVQKIAQRPGRAAEQEEKAALASEHRGVFTKWMRRGKDGGAEDELAEVEKKSVNIGSDAAGGFAVPEQLDQSIGQIERDATPMRQVCTVLQVGNETYEKLFNKGGAGSGWVGETDARGETTAPALASVKPFFGEVYANPQVTQKALDDMMFDAGAWLADEVGLAFAAAENTAFTASSGNGTNKPKGILAYTLAETADATRAFGQLEKYTTAAQAAITGDELIKFTEKLRAGYRQNARWMFAAPTAAYIRTLKAVTDGTYLWRPGIEAGQPDLLLGFPVTRNEDVPAIAAGAACVLFGDFRRGYTVADVRGIRVLRDPYTSKPYVGFYSTRRVGGGVMDSLAIKVLVAKT